ncbi:glycogen debranching N-terminal domain-containing protein [Nucisporomicrobium flavum]|uniref:amylo-alpha-1,6-glucosidase n=1 Tax=Nucisporomicrobium flavum TaxID=2785915 RepID=UPI003C2EEFB0
MTAASGPLNAGEPATADAAVTLFAGPVFCLSDRWGDIAPGSAHGLFVRDARVLSGWQLRLGDGRPEALAAQAPDAYAGRFVLRGPGGSGLLLVRERLVDDGLREVLTVRNLGRTAVECELTLTVAADFADLFAVKDGRGGPGAADTAAGDGELRLTSRSDAGWGVRVTASGDPLLEPGRLAWHVAVPARGSWHTEIVVEAMVGGRWITPGFERGKPASDSGAGRRLRAWRTAVARIDAADPGLAAALRRTEDDLGALQAPDPRTGRPFVAAGAPWYMTLFGRDSLLTAWMTLPLDLSLAVGTLQALAATQGRTIDPATEEQPGRILHELRLGPDNDRTLGGSRYYGTADATPLFVMLLAEAWRWGAPEAVVRELLPAADAALQWIDGYGDRDGDGFVEYERAAGHGLINQGWKDSADAVSFADGSPARTPIALCEVQAYVHAALLGRAELADAFGDPGRAAACRDRAARLRESFADAFWLPGRGWYALALDGAKRPVDALTSNAAHALWTGIATDAHAETLVARLSSSDMDTGYGLRTMSRVMGAYDPMSYHNGSVWPHDTAIAVAGLLRYAHVPGAAELAHRLAAGVLDAAAAFSARLPELYCGFGRDEFAPPVPYPTSCSPQAWAAAAPLLLVRAALGLEPDVPRRTVGLTPRLPASWGEVTVSGLRLGPATLRITAEADAGELTGLPPGWRRAGA